MTPPLDVDALRLQAADQVDLKPGQPPRHRPGERFLKGPIPMEWLALAAKLPGKALHVGMAVWHLAGMKRSSTVILTASLLRSLGVTRYAARRALKVLEQAQLVSVGRHRGRNPTVVLLEARLPLVSETN